MLAARSIGSILTTVEKLHNDDELALATLDVHSIGIDASFQSGFLQDFNLHHEGSECNTSGHPYYRRSQMEVDVSDSFLAGILSFCYLIAPDAFALERKDQDALEEDQRLSPFEFLQRLLDNCHWPVQEARVMDKLTKLVVNRGYDCLQGKAVREKVLTYFREMSQTKNSDYDADILQQHFPDREEPSNQENPNLGWLSNEEENDGNRSYPRNSGAPKRSGFSKSIFKQQPQKKQPPKAKGRGKKR